MTACGKKKEGEEEEDMVGWWAERNKDQKGKKACFKQGGREKVNVDFSSTSL